MNSQPSSETHLVREAATSATFALVGAIVPAIVSLSPANAAVVHTMRDVAVGLLPMIFLNALMSALIPAVITLRRIQRASGGPGLLASLAIPAAIVLGLAMGGTIAAIGTIHLAAFAFSLSGLAASGVMLVRAVQAVLVAVILTPLTIVLLSSRHPHG